MQASESWEKFRFGAVALGANLPSRHGTPSETLHFAIKLLENTVEISAVSPHFTTPAFPAGAGPDYVNAAVSFCTNICARDILLHLHRIEAQIGRVRDQRWGARAVDLDLLFLDDVVIPDVATQSEWRNLPMDRQIRATPDQLILPHPRLQDRSFVLVPLSHVAPDWVHPLTQQSVTTMLSALPAQDIASVRSLVAGA